jgi:ABC-type phosphate transport system substrate-binding protein
MRGIVKLALVVTLALAAGPALAEPVAIVVNRENPKSSLTTEELKSIYLGRRTEWPDGTRTVPIDQAPSAPGRAAFLDAVLGMSKAHFAEHWVDQQVRGNGSAPKVAASPAAAVKLVARVKGAVAFVPVSQVTAAVKVVFVDGKLPGERGYPLP